MALAGVSPGTWDNFKWPVLEGLLSNGEIAFKDRITTCLVRWKDKCADSPLCKKLGPYMSSSHCVSTLRNPDRDRVLTMIRGLQQSRCHEDGMEFVNGSHQCPLGERLNVSFAAS